MDFVNKYLRNFEPYKVASHKIWTVDPKEREQILKLDWNEATIPPSPKSRERIKNLVANDNFYNLYPSTYNAELMKLLSEYTELPEENIQYFASSDSLHEYLAKLYITVGDPVLILGPSYDNFRLTAEVCGASLYYYYIDDEMSFSAEKFEQTIKDIRPSMVYICNPNNPTGNYHSVEYIEHLIKTYSETLFLVDEAYIEFSNGESAKNLVQYYDNLVISRTMSKAFALANFRFGYLLASTRNVNYINSVRNPKNINTFTQEAVIGALSDIPYMQSYVSEVKRAKTLFEEGLNRYSDFLTYHTSEGNFVLLICKNNKIKRNLFKYLQDHDIYVRMPSQTPFLKEKGVRVSIGTRKQMKQVLSVMDEFFGDMDNA